MVDSRTTATESKTQSSLLEETNALLKDEITTDTLLRDTTQREIGAQSSLFSDEIQGIPESKINPEMLPKAPEESDTQQATPQPNEKDSTQKKETKTDGLKWVRPKLPGQENSGGAKQENNEKLNSDTPSETTENKSKQNTSIPEKSDTEAQETVKQNGSLKWVRPDSDKKTDNMETETSSETDTKLNEEKPPVNEKTQVTSGQDNTPVNPENTPKNQPDNVTPTSSIEKNDQIKRNSSPESTKKQNEITFNPPQEGFLADCQIGENHISVAENGNVFICADGQCAVPTHCLPEGVELTQESVRQFIQSNHNADGLTNLSLINGTDTKTEGSKPDTGVKQEGYGELGKVNRMSNDPGISKYEYEAALQNPHVVIITSNPSTCGPCRTLEPQLNGLAQRLGKNGVKVFVTKNYKLENPRAIPNAVEYVNGVKTNRNSTGPADILQEFSKL